LATSKLPDAQLRLLGFLPLAFFTAQAIHYWQTNELGHTLWMCNIGNLLLAIGLFLEEALVIRVAVIWMVPGLAVWALYVVPTWGMLLAGEARLSQFYGVITSTLAHVGGLSVGLVVLRRVRMDGRAWFYAFLWYLVVQALSRLLTPADLNVNLAHRIQEGWEQTFSSYWKFWCVLSVLTGILLWIFGYLLQQLWPISRESPAAAPST
jgi:hypothetical protein